MKRDRQILVSFMLKQAKWRLKCPALLEYCCLGCSPYKKCTSVLRWHTALIRQKFRIYHPTIIYFHPKGSKSMDLKLQIITLKVGEGYALGQRKTISSKAKEIHIVSTTDCAVCIDHTKLLVYSIDISYVIKHSVPRLGPSHTLSITVVHRPNSDCM